VGNLVNKKLLGALFFPFAAYCGTHHSQAVDPLSKIVVTSTDAVCAKDIQRPGIFRFQYRNNVRVHFADNSSITADFLEIILDSKKAAAHNGKLSPDISNFKQITFTGHVKLVSAQRKAEADAAHVFLIDQRVVLEGSVKIWQCKQKLSDIPVAIQSSRAELSLLSGQVHLFGDTLNPVSTTIVLRGHPSLQSKKKQVKMVNNGTDSSSATS
jgi:lipopolysaccharide export system protein LptA